MPVRRDAEFVLDGKVEYPDEIWDLIVDVFDWNRALLEAQGRHLELHHDKDQRDMDIYICGECLAEALKQNSTWPDWKKRMADR